MPHSLVYLRGLEKRGGRMSALEELENELFETLVNIRAGERKVEKIKMQIRAIKPDFVDLDIIGVLSKPLSELTSPIDGNEEKPHRSEVEEDPITQAQRERQEP